MIGVNSRAHRRDDHFGDPLDGLVNMFDVGVVLAVGFLIAALSSLKLTHIVSDSGLTSPASNAIVVDQSQTPKAVPPNGKKVIGHGEQVGQVYKLDDGRLVYVTKTP